MDEEFENLVAARLGFLEARVAELHAAHLFGMENPLAVLAAEKRRTDIASDAASTGPTSDLEGALVLTAHLRRANSDFWEQVETHLRYLLQNAGRL
jgi:hypothetical protein